MFKKEIIGKDNSGFAEPILFEEDYHLIDSFTTIDNDTERDYFMDSMEALNYGIVDKILK